ncbi:MAG: exodeoxyribonuclease VII large subunit [Planctomycetota bacterium]
MSGNPWQEAAPSDSGPRVLTVSELQRKVRLSLEGDFGRVWVEGEISGLSAPASGHCYFTLKDSRAQLRAVLWRSTVRRLKFEVEEGMAVRARGNLTIYEPRGSYQMIVDGLEPVGTGPLQVAFEQLRLRLEQEGLFDAAHKRELPRFPRRVALITSPSGAAVHDLIEVMQRRWPGLELVVVPVKVQGEGAATEIADGIRLADGAGFDVLIIGRGGGSLEDLWAFNEEPVARALFAARTPAISAVGHEVDVTIADLVADVRAPTPSAAAEIVAPDRRELGALLEQRRLRLVRALRGVFEDARQRLARLEASHVFRRPLERVRREEQRLDETGARMQRALRERLYSHGRDVAELSGRLEALSPLRVLARGYSVTLTADTDRVVRRAADLRAGDRIRTVLGEGEILGRVEEVRPPPPEGSGGAMVK